MIIPIILPWNTPLGRGTDRQKPFWETENAKYILGIILNIMTHQLRTGLIVFCIAMLCCASNSYGQGIFLRAAGAVNESMGGAGTAAPLDSTGALFCNPGSITELDRNEVSIGLGLVLPTCKISTSIPGLGSQSTEGDPGAVPVPSMSFIYRPNPCSRVTYGFSMSAFAGAKLAYPYLGDQKYNIPGVGTVSPLASLGTLNSDIYLLQMTPIMAYKINDQLSFGFGPSICMAQVLCDPLFVSGRPGETSFPNGTSSRYAWGAGFQLGLYYRPNCCWSFGFTYKSQMWMENFQYNTIETDSEGNKFAGKRYLDLNVPDVMSFGIAFHGFEKTIIALDLRRFGYADSGGDYLRMGWRNLFGLNLGVQRIINDRLTVRFGYAYNDCPYTSQYTLSNSATPMITQHVLFMGGTIKISEHMSVTGAYSHAFTNSITGPVSAALPISVSSEIGADTITAGVRFQF